MKKWSLFALTSVAVLVISLAAGACNSKSTPGPTPIIPTATSTPGQPTITPVALQITVNLTNYSFSPSTIAIPQGRAVQIILHSDLGEHSFTSDDLHVDVPVDTSADAVKSLRVDVPGNYVFYSKAAADKAHGMYGNLVVLPQ